MKRKLDAALFFHSETGEFEADFNKSIQDALFLRGVVRLKFISLPPNIFTDGKPMSPIRDGRTIQRCCDLARQASIPLLASLNAHDIRPNADTARVAALYRSLLSDGFSGVLWRGFRPRHLALQEALATIQIEPKMIIAVQDGQTSMPKGISLSADYWITGNSPKGVWGSVDRCLIECTTAKAVAGFLREKRHEYPQFCIESNVTNPAYDGMEYEEMKFIEHVFNVVHGGFCKFLVPDLDLDQIDRILNASSAFPNP